MSEASFSTPLSLGLGSTIGVRGSGFRVYRRARRAQQAPCAGEAAHILLCFSDRV